MSSPFIKDSIYRKFLLTLIHIAYIIFRHYYVVIRYSLLIHRFCFCFHLEQFQHIHHVFPGIREAMEQVPRVMSQEDDKYKDLSPKRFRSYVTSTSSAAGPKPFIGSRLLLVPVDIQRGTMTSLNVDSFNFNAVGDGGGDLRRTTSAVQRLHVTATSCDQPSKNSWAAALFMRIISCRQVTAGATRHLI